MARTTLSDKIRKERSSMTKLNNDTAPKSGTGSDADRLSQSPQEIRRGSAEYTDIGAGEVTKDAGNFGYDKNDVPTGVEPPPFGASH
jgi:hypothetical protein